MPRVTTCPRSLDDIASKAIGCAHINVLNGISKLSKTNTLQSFSVYLH